MFYLFASQTHSAKVVALNDRKAARTASAASVASSCASFSFVSSSNFSATTKLQARASSNFARNVIKTASFSSSWSALWSNWAAKPVFPAAWKQACAKRTD